MDLQTTLPAPSTSRRGTCSEARRSCLPAVGCDDPAAATAFCVAVAAESAYNGGPGKGELVCERCTEGGQVRIHNQTSKNNIIVGGAQRCSPNSKAAGGDGWHATAAADGRAQQRYMYRGLVRLLPHLYRGGLAAARAGEVVVGEVSALVQSHKAPSAAGAVLRATLRVCRADPADADDCDALLHTLSELWAELPPQTRRPAAGRPPPLRAPWARRLRRALDPHALEGRTRSHPTGESLGVTQREGPSRRCLGDKNPMRSGGVGAWSDYSRPSAAQHFRAAARRPPPPPPNHTTARWWARAGRARSRVGGRGATAAPCGTVAAAGKITKVMHHPTLVRREGWGLRERHQRGRLRKDALDEGGRVLHMKRGECRPCTRAGWDELIVQYRAPVGGVRGGVGGVRGGVSPDHRMKQECGKLPHQIVFDAMKGWGIRRDEYTFTNAIKACGRDWVRAKQLLTQMRDELGKSDKFACTAVMNCCANGGAAEEAGVSLGQQPSSLPHPVPSDLVVLTLVYSAGGMHPPGYAKMNPPPHPQNIPGHI
eukprot:gene15149-biopygen15961